VTHLGDALEELSGQGLGAGHIHALLHKQDAATGRLVALADAQRAVDGLRLAAAAHAGDHGAARRQELRRRQAGWLAGQAWAAIADPQCARCCLQAMLITGRDLRACGDFRTCCTTRRPSLPVAPMTSTAFSRGRGRAAISGSGAAACACSAAPAPFSLFCLSWYPTSRPTPASSAPPRYSASCGTAASDRAEGTTVVKGLARRRPWLGARRPCRIVGFMPTATWLNIRRMVGGGGGGERWKDRRWRIL
jgi:hypothetical protein